MLNIKVLYDILNPENTVRYLYFLLLAALIPLLDCYLIILLATLTGKYLFMAILFVLSILGFYMARHMIKKNLRIIRNNTENHYYSEYYYFLFPGTVLVSIFLIMPGIIGKAVALIVSIPEIRHRCGKLISRFLRIEWKEIHEFINVIE
ncbi:MAG: FxsA family protein [Spirochaetales bacterium]|nr:FxsA family protein [Spirochaetales bacterium]